MRMNNMKIIIIMSLIMCMVFTGCSTSVNSDYATKEEQLDEFMKQYFNTGDEPSISILVIDKGEAVYKKSFGCGNVDTLEKATPKSTYRLASISKMFTAMGIMILKDRGQLDFDTPVKDILEDFPKYGEDITINHLLNHTSGLRDFYDLTDLLDEDFDVKNQIVDSDVYEIVKKAGDTYFKPGSIYKYADTGYIMLGLIIEEVSGENLSDFMKENIFNPLGMHDTVVYDKRLNMTVNNRAYGTDHDGIKYFTKDQSYSSATRGDGSIYSSLEDLYKWNQALYTSKLVSLETMNESYSPPKFINSKWDNYTCGWVFRKNGSEQLELAHSGGTQGFSNFYFRMVDEKQAIILLSNRNESDTIYFGLDEEIRKIYNMAKMTY